MTGLRPPGERYEFLDLYRTVVILFMFQGHVFREFLAGAYRDDGWFEIHEVLHGATAPAFLFTAGMSFVIASQRYRGEYLRWSPRLHARFRRIGMIFALGLFIHLPYFSFRRMVVDASPHEKLLLFQSDVLTCIAVCLLLLHLALLATRDERRFTLIVGLLMLAVVLLTPVMWAHDFQPGSGEVSLVAQLWNAANGSPFPLFPFAAYLLFGVLVATRFVRAVEEGKVPWLMRRIAVAGAAAAAAGLVLALLPWSIYPASIPVDFWYTGPAYFVIRAGLLMLCVPLAAKAAELLPQAWRGILVLGRESLFVYVLHLAVLYGTVINGPVNMRALLPSQVSYPAAVGLSAALAAMMFGAARLWERMKAGRPRIYRTLQFGLSGVVLYLFFTLDY